MSPQIESIGKQLESIFRADKAFINRPNIEKKSELGKVGSFEYSKIQDFNSKCYVKCRTLCISVLRFGTIPFGPGKDEA